MESLWEWLRRRSGGERAVAGGTVLYLLAAVAAMLQHFNGEFLFYLAVLLLLILAAIVVHRRVHFTTLTLAALSLWGAMHMAGGLVPVPASWPIQGTQRVLYSVWLVPERLKYDQWVHAFGFGVTTWVCWQGLKAACRPRVQAAEPASLARRDVSLAAEVHYQESEPLQPTLGLLSLCVAAGMGLGAANEVVEFAATKLVPETNVGGYENTGWDLVSNLIGAVAAALLIRAFETRQAEQRKEM